MHKGRILILSNCNTPKQKAINKQHKYSSWEITKFRLKVCIKGMNLEGDCIGCVALNCPPHSHVWILSLQLVVLSGELGGLAFLEEVNSEFKGSSHFKLDLCFMLPVLDVSTQFPALTAMDLLCHQCSNPAELQINSSKSCLGYDVLSQ